MKNMVVDVEPRAQIGKNESRRLRRAGLIPGVVYGARRESVPVTVDPRKLLDIIHSDSGVNTIFELNLGGPEPRAHVMIREYQVDPVKGRLIHADLVRIRMDEELEVDVPVQSTGEAAGVKLDGGILDHVTREVRVACLPGDIPEHIAIDVSPLKIGDAIRVADLPKSDRYRILTEPDVTLVVVAPPAKEETAAVAAPEVAAAAPSEPEVIKKGKAATEGAEGGEAEEEGEARKKDARKPEGKK
jgi:large subunit ribosomal protein L25